uniref:Putative secreted protein n=1 Tax=Anopheles darlingi TaxID=43151 RepID=A0A2M4D0I1_ANODA
MPPPVPCAHRTNGSPLLWLALLWFASDHPLPRNCHFFRTLCSWTRYYPFPWMRGHFASNAPIARAG